MKLVIAGANGMLGKDLAAVSAEKHEVFLTDLKISGKNSFECDITDPEEVKRNLKEVRPSAIINASAYTDVDGCEERQDLAYSVNASGPANLAEYCRESGTTLIHVSTDYVFDGLSRRPYHETDAVNPLGVYGKSKLEGELSVQKELKEHYIVRTSLLYGRHRSNFVTKILDKVIAGERITVPDDMIGSPTYSMDLAVHLIKFLEAKPDFGIYHASNSGHCSRYEWALKIAEFAGKDADITPIKSSTLKSKAPRPLYSALDISKLSGFSVMRDWKTALAEFVSEYLRKYS